MGSLVFRILAKCCCKYQCRCPQNWWVYHLHRRCRHEQAGSLNPYHSIKQKSHYPARWCGDVEFVALEWQAKGRQWMNIWSLGAELAARERHHWQKGKSNKYFDTNNESRYLIHTRNAKIRMLVLIPGSQWRRHSWYLGLRKCEVC